MAQVVIAANYRIKIGLKFGAFVAVTKIPRDGESLIFAGNKTIL